MSAFLPLHLLLLVLWAQFFTALAPAWLAGGYYDYAWYVGPAAAWFFYRRWKESPERVPRGWTGRDTAVLVVWLAALAAIRVLGQVDPLWRLPLWGHAGLVVVATHWWLAAGAGWRISRNLLPVTLFALTAVPYPTGWEHALVQHLTDAVVSLAVELFRLAGKPVMAVGDQLVLDGKVMEVTDGCSGVRSFQSFLMAALFFGELFRLGAGGRGALLVVGLGLAVGVNAVRAMYLSGVGFARGTEAAAAAHDPAGFAAFFISALLFLLAASLIEKAGKAKKPVRRRMVGPSATP